MGYKFLKEQYEKLNRDASVYEEVDEEMPDTFDLSASVTVADLDDAELLFRESIIKAFYEITVRTGKHVYGYSKEDLEKMQNEIIEEFEQRGRRYDVPLDRNSDNCNIQRGKNGVPDIGNAPKEAKNIVSSVYNKCIKDRGDKSPSDVDDNSTQSACTRKALTALKDAGYAIDNDGDWKKRGKSSTKQFFRFITDPEVRLRQHDFPTGKCEYCQYFHDMRCNVLEHMVSAEQVCDAYSGSYYFSDSDGERKYTIENFNKFIRGLVDNKILQSTIIRSLDTPVGILIIFKDNMKPDPHYFSISVGEFIESTISKNHWMQSEVDAISNTGGFINE